MSNSLSNDIDLNTFTETVTTIDNIQDVVSNSIDPRVASILRTKINQTEDNVQSGGFNFLSPLIAIFEFIIKILGIVAYFIFGIFKELFFFPWKQKNRALFWKYLWFCIQCGFLLILFTIGGPIFIIIGVCMIYRKLLKKWVSMAYNS
jgi:hypothetical protein